MTNKYGHFKSIRGTFLFNKMLSRACGRDEQIHGHLKPSETLMRTQQYSRIRTNVGYYIPVYCGDRDLDCSSDCPASSLGVRGGGGPSRLGYMGDMKQTGCR